MGQMIQAPVRGEPASGEGSDPVEAAAGTRAASGWSANRLQSSGSGRLAGSRRALLSLVQQTIRVFEWRKSLFLTGADAGGRPLYQGSPSSSRPARGSASPSLW